MAMPHGCRRAKHEEDRPPFGKQGGTEARLSGGAIFRSKNPSH
jgi:hypothetical protein